MLAMTPRDIRHCENRDPEHYEGKWGEAIHEAALGVIDETARRLHYGQRTQWDVIYRRYIKLGSTRLPTSRGVGIGIHVPLRL